ncbi:MAG TPA: hypothetical protein VKG26_13010 [Bacteroidia bacterium]|nr:hypothetical protein [Bacteroidia bacterium]
MNYTKIVSANPLKQWQNIVVEDLQVCKKNPVFVLAGKFRVFPLRIFWQTQTATGDRLIAYLIDTVSEQGKLLVFFTFSDDVNMITEFSIRRSGYFCKELSELLTLSLLQRIRKDDKHNVSNLLLPNIKRTKS